MKLFYICPILIYSFIVPVSEGILPSLFRDAHCGGGGFQAADLHWYVENLKPGSNTTIGLENFLRWLEMTN
jgi:hypothetical protein